MRVIFSCLGTLAAAAAIVWTSPAADRSLLDGGAGTYSGSGTTYYFDLSNTGTTPWQYFVLAGPPGTRWVGAATSAENTARCVPGQPDGRAESIECGPIGPTVERPGAHLLLVGTLAAPVACGARFALDVSSDGVQPFARGSDVTRTGSCATIALRAITRPTIQGVGLAGHMLTASPASWTSSPSRIRYRWERCTTSDCTAIPGATTRRLRLTPRLAGLSVRIVATASASGMTASSASRKIAVRYVRPAQRRAKAPN